MFFGRLNLVCLWVRGLWVLRVLSWVRLSVGSRVVMVGFFR